MQILSLMEFKFIKSIKGIFQKNFMESNVQENNFGGEKLYKSNKTDGIAQ